MEVYREYPVRCKTCNELIDALAPEYEQLLRNGVSVEGALNAIGLTNYCSRIAMMAPTIVSFNMENRDLIEGFKSADAVDEPMNVSTHTSYPQFKNCLNASIAGIKSSAPQKEPPRESSSGTTEEEDLGRAIDLEMEEREVDMPVRVGISVINERDTPAEKVYVGAGRYVKVLTGRTYLAR